jgi:hypothetical protein
VPRLPNPRRLYLRILKRVAPDTVTVLREQCGLDRAAAAEAFAAVAGLGLAGLARHQRRRPENPRAAVEVVRKYGRPADLDAPELGIAAHLQRPDLSSRLGGLLGDAGPRAAEWVARRTGAPTAAVDRAMAAAAPLSLGALEAGLTPAELTVWLARLPDDAIERTDALLDPRSDCAETFRCLRRRALPWWQRVLGLSG